VILAVMALILISIGGDRAAVSPPPSPEGTQVIPTFTPPPTPTPTPTPEISTADIFFYNVKTPEFSTSIGDTTQLSVRYYPLDVEVSQVWSSEDESICKVSQNGLVTAVGPGWVTIYVTVGTRTATCRVLVRQPAG